MNYICDMVENFEGQFGRVWIHWLYKTTHPILTNIQLNILISQDFTLIEYGPLQTLDELIAGTKQEEKNGASFSYNFPDITSLVNGSSAWMIYINDCDYDGW